MVRISQQPIILLLLVFLSLRAVSLAQSSHPALPQSAPGLPQGVAPPPAPPVHPQLAPDDAPPTPQQKAMEKKANIERQKQIKNDTDKLLRLATDLKEYVDKSTENTLSLDVIRKAEEIEKLAHSVKEKMKGN
jgi:hypothetical protein